MRKPDPSDEEPNDEGGARKLPDLWENLELVCEAVAAYAPRFRFRDSVIASALGLEASTWSKMKYGRRPIPPTVLSGLIRHIGFGLVPGVLQLPKAAFRTWMEDNRIGLFDPARRRPALHGLLDRAYASWGRTGASAPRLTIQRRLRGGIDILEPEKEDCRFLVLGDRIRFEVSFPKGGHVLVLNEQLDNSEITALVPSPLHEKTDAEQARPFVLPKEHDLVVTRPFGYYRVYGLWSTERFPVTITSFMSEGVTTPRGKAAAVIDPAKTRELTDFISRDGQVLPNRRIVALDYKVVPRL